MIFTKLSSQIKWANHWRWLKLFKKEPPHRNVVIKQLTSHVATFGRLMALFSKATSDEKSPLVAFVISVVNILVSNPVKDEILAVVMQSCLKCLQSDEVAARAFAITTLTSFSLRHTNQRSKLDDALVRRILKSALRSEAPLNQQALEAAAAVLYASSDGFGLPDKFSTRAVDMIGRGDVKFSNTTISNRLGNALLSKSVEMAVNSESQEKTIAVSAAIKLLQAGTKHFNLEDAFNTAISAGFNSVASEIILEMRRQQPEQITPKLSETFDEAEGSKLAPEIAIHHANIKVRRNAIKVRVEKY